MVEFVLQINTKLLNVRHCRVGRFSFCLFPMLAVIGRHARVFAEPYPASLVADSPKINVLRRCYKCLAARLALNVHNAAVIKGPVNPLSCHWICILPVCTPRTTWWNKTLKSRIFRQVLSLLKSLTYESTSFPKFSLSEHRIVYAYDLLVRHLTNLLPPRNRGIKPS